MKKKVCLVTWYRSMNYGTVLQCLALYKKIEKLDYEVFLPKKTSYFSIMEPFDLFRRSINKISNKFKPMNSAIEFSELKNEFKEGYSIRIKKINNFIDNQFNFYNSNKNYFKSLEKNMDVFITGSDQIWNPKYVTISNLLAFASKEKRKVAYASSIGVDHISGRIRKTYKKYLCEFDLIGVREKTAEKELKKLLKESTIVQNVLDPTFLINKEEWKALSENSNIIYELSIKKKYLLCYFIGKHSQSFKYAKQFAMDNDLEMITVLSESFICPEFGKVCSTAGIEDFIKLILNANYILTDSFHAVALSINFKKQFSVYNRFKNSEKESQNSRIYDLLSKFEITDRLFEETDCFYEAEIIPINFSEVNKILNYELEKSCDFLEKALKI